MSIVALNNVWLCEALSVRRIYKNVTIQADMRDAVKVWKNRMWAVQIECETRHRLWLRFVFLTFPALMVNSCTWLKGGGSFAVVLDCFLRDCLLLHCENPRPDPQEGKLFLSWGALTISLKTQTVTCVHSVSLRRLSLLSFRISAGLSWSTLTDLASWRLDTV